MLSLTSGHYGTQDEYDRDNQPKGETMTICMQCIHLFRAEPESSPRGRMWYNLACSKSLIATHVDPVTGDLEPDESCLEVEPKVARTDRKAPPMLFLAYCRNVNKGECAMFKAH